jgi:hypothetical protein
VTEKLEALLVKRHTFMDLVLYGSKTGFSVKGCGVDVPEEELELTPLRPTFYPRNS